MMRLSEIIGGRRIFLGAFAPETIWSKLSGEAQLPRPRFGVTYSAMSSMDELLFLLCGAEDCSWISCKRSELLAQYLSTIGFPMIEYSCSDGKEGPEDIWAALKKNGQCYRLQQLVSRGYEIEPYAVTPAAEGIFALLSRREEYPSVCNIVRVNSKVWSQRVRRKLGVDYNTTVVESSKELLERGSEMLNKGMIVIKEAHGVAGMGSTVVRDFERLLGLYSFMKKIEAGGKVVRLVIEPFLEKMWDFSSHFYLFKSGKVLFLSLQAIKNNGLKYEGSCTLDPEKQAAIFRTGYLRIISIVGEALEAEGYWGPVCVDSMVLSSGNVVPIVEINARMSMGLLNHHLTLYLRKWQRRCYLTAVPILGHKDPSFEEIFSSLETHKLIFNPRTNVDGCIPLTSNTVSSHSGVRKLFVGIPYVTDLKQAQATIERIAQVI
jgi:hypothetical protein